MQLIQLHLHLPVLANNPLILGLQPLELFAVLGLPGLRLDLVLQLSDFHSELLHLCHEPRVLLLQLLNVGWLLCLLLELSFVC